MRVSINNQAKEFIIKSKNSNKYVYLSKEIKLSLKNFLISNNLLCSPIRGIFILKNSSVNKNTILKKYKFEIISKLGGVISGPFVLDYYLGTYKNSKNITIINQSKNFNTYLLGNKGFKIIFKLSKVVRITKVINLEGSELEIETPLSFIVNNFFLYQGNKKFDALILKQDLNSGEVINMLLKGFKLSGLSKLAIFYKNNNLNGKFKLIENEIIESGKKLDRRKNKINIKNIVKKKYTKNIDDLDALFNI